MTENRSDTSGKSWSLSNLFKQNESIPGSVPVPEMADAVAESPLVKPAMLMYEKAEVIDTNTDPRSIVEYPRINTLQANQTLAKISAPCPKPSIRPEHAPPFTMEGMSKALQESENIQALSNCPQPNRPNSSQIPVKNIPKNFISKTGSMAARVVLASTIIWWTYDIGIWGDAKSTERLWVRARNALGQSQSTNRVCVE